MGLRVVTRVARGWSVESERDGCCEMALTARRRRTNLSSSASCPVVYFREME